MNSPRPDKMAQEEIREMLSQTRIDNDRILTENDLKDLPEPVKKWLRHSGSVGRPFIAIGKVLQIAEMKMKPGQKKWMKARAVQYTTTDVPAFIWTVKVKTNSLFFFTGRDKFVDGKGHMLIMLNSLVNVVNEQGEKLDEGTMQRYLGEMVWFPSLALSSYITWQQIDDSSALGTMNYKGTEGSGIFYFNSDGDLARFSAMRYKENNPEAKKYEWVLQVNDYSVFDGIRVPSKMTATWKLDGGDWTWLKLEITGISYNSDALI